ncbi:DNA internalization-related competence protein ComEC/Rec2 [Ectothiorhodospira variabilis]|uniref:DNA internalization-related competence protein ComEC/Rec2 n=1 Tax=Ectothiorhodospira variabilis TaxID=505694 RepID=UPI001EFAD3BE|nr:DNA internalization-related competence protein ComEC/Rec2 [Ectothiorhodospira variabilis]MCG5493142.1 DNA internalization-related competence protein ComEC/Rec2 [Ectothiorhodospira variabilis]MCG5502471.1 DNA internalization-related competence protein ComEC/Rec2 [Ectothiorhodospira variabilis]MCG5505763.1 DNA internalization-related competence protein ComEC/Rec2 [Ectothiorhodospira variabilis]
MQGRALVFLAGVMLLHSLGELPAPGWAWLLLALPIFYRFAPSTRWPLWAMAGFLWALIHAHWVVGPPLDPSLSGQDVRVVGIVDSLPEPMERGVRFGFRIESASDDDSTAALPGRVRVAWYGQAPDLAPGERWELTLRLRQPNGLRNPGGFDYEGWLFQQGFRATGYVRDGHTARRLGTAHSPARHVDRLRAAVAGRMDAALGEAGYGGILRALAVGDRSAISQAQWATLIDTGTNHLTAISGLHVGLVAGMGYAIMLWGWRRVPALALRLPAQRVAVIAALICATGYAALAGFAVPTQRALVMLAVALGAVWLGRTARPSHTLALALMAVLVLDPRAVLAPGFWLSFAAVAVILYAVAARVGPMGKTDALLRVQWVAGVGLLPLTLVMFQHGSLISPLANLFAVPWVSFVVVPLVLVGVGLSPWVPWAAEALWGLAHLAVWVLWPVLEHLADWPGAQWRAAPPAWTLMPALLGLAWFMAPRAWPARWLGLLLLLPMLWPPRADLEPGAFRVAMLDVGQGLAVVVKTAGHTLVYDTGPRFSPRFDAGEAAVVPYLRHQGRDRVDALMISHGDNDHIGGAASVLSRLSVNAVLSRDPGRLDHPDSMECLEGQEWAWDGVVFRVLHPPPFWGDDNESSCVLRIQGSGGSVLLTGDVEGLGEAVLVHSHGPGLASDVLLVPHHGAATSLSEPFLDRVSPQLALVSTGFENRFGHPHEQTLERLERRRIPLMDTAGEGAFRVDVHPDAGVRVHPGYRHVGRRHWHRP